MLRWLFGRRKNKPKWIIELAPEVQSDVTLAAAWAVYAGTKGLVRMGEYFELYPDRRGQNSEFDEETFARDALAEHWAQASTVDKPSAPYLDFLHQVREAEFIREYVWKFLPKDDWAEPVHLDLNGFNLWLEEHDASEHKPLTLASITAGDTE